MPAEELFERLGPQFAEHAATARVNAERQADVERLIGKAEYECLQLRRELAGLIALGAEPADQEMQAEPVASATVAPAKAA